MAMLLASVFAGGGGSVLEACATQRAIVASACPCVQEANAHRAAQPALGEASCCAVERAHAPASPLPAATVQVTPQVAAPPALVLALTKPALPPLAPVLLLDAPRSQGPPVFLKVRSLLI
jgi:hypothetical protein